MHRAMSDTRGRSLHHYYWWTTAGYAVIGLVAYLSLTPTPPKLIEAPFIDKLEHLIAYSILMGWFAQIYVTRNRQIILAILFCLLGIMLEILQGVGGQRFFEYGDMMANALGVLLGWWLSNGVCRGWLARVDHFLSLR